MKGKIIVINLHFVMRTRDSNTKRKTVKPKGKEMEKGRGIC